ncbi:MAG: DNA polymerase III subunit beta [Novosphingobium sp.]
MITVDRKQFTRAVALASTVVERRNTLPVLSGLKISANGSLALHGSNLDECTTAELPCQGDGFETCLLSPREVAAALNAGGGGQVELTEPGDDNRLAVRGGQLHARVATLPADDHPGAERILSEDFACEIGAAELGAIARVVPAISTEETRYYLNGICVHKVGEWLWRFAATDGHRLMMVDVPLPGATGAIPDGTIIPRRWIEKVLHHFRKAKQGARLTYGPTAIANRDDGADLAPAKPGIPRISVAGMLVDDIRFTVTGKLIDGTYPDYTRVIPAAPGFVARLKRADLVQAINALTPLATERRRAVKLIFETDSILCQLNSPDVGEGSFRIPAEHKAPANFNVAFNAQYLLDICAVLLGDEVELGLTHATYPTLVSDPADTAFRAVLMPMRV